MYLPILKYLLFLALTNYCAVIYAQDYIVRTKYLSVEDGLSNRFVRSIVPVMLTVFIFVTAG